MGTSEQGITVRETGSAMERWGDAAERGLQARQAREAIVARVLKPELDYGVIPGTGSKPTLLKPGAEKIADALNLYPDYEVMQRIEDFDRPLFSYGYKCILRARGSDQIVATGIGSCNSQESKYRWRNVPEWQASEIEKAAAVQKLQRKNKNGSIYTVFRIVNDDIASQVNTIDKMAQKRALVAAALNLGFSEQFTQDIEDNPEAHGARDVPPPVAMPQPKAKPPASGTNWQGTIISVREKSGSGAKGPWTVHFIDGDGDFKCSTFDTVLADTARQFSGTGEIVQINYAVGPKGNTVEAIIPVDAPPAEAKADDIPF